MNPHDLKRLIAGFLAFSIATSAATLIFLNFAGQQKPQQDALQIEGESPLTTISKNAFVENLPSNSQGAGSQSAYSDNSADSSNLTQNFTKEFAKQIIESNPDGPKLDANGDSAINVPPEDSATNIVLHALSTANIKIAADIKDSDLKIEKKYTPKDVNSYFNAVNSVLVDSASSTKYLSITDENSAANSLYTAQLAFAATEQKLKMIPVPNFLLGMHRALIGFFANQNNVFEMAADYQNDPLKSIIVLKNSDQIISGDIANFKNEFRKVEPELVSYQYLDGKNISLFESILGIKTAYAIFGIGDITFDPTLNFTTVANWAKDFLGKAEDWAYKIALQALKNQLLAQLQNQIVDWISGSGKKPKFITDWNGFLSDAANKAAGQAISQLVPQACSGFGPLLKIALMPVPYANTGVRCTLDQVVSNTNAFFNRFKNGTWYQTWTGYGALLQPTGNFFGQVIAFNDITATAQMKAQKSASDKAVADKGFLSVQKCVAYDDSNPPNCTQYVDTTPGAVVGDTLVKSLGWPVDSVISAQDVIGLVSAIVNSTINRLTKEAVSGLSDLVSSPPAAPSSGTSPQISNNLNYALSSLDQTGIFQENQNIIAADTQWLSLGMATSSDSTISQLNQLSKSCSAASNQVSQRITDITTMAQTVQAELNKANLLADMKSAAATTTSTQDIANLISQVQAMDLTAITNTAKAAQKRFDSLQYFTYLVIANISAGAPSFDSPGCSQSLPPITVTPPPPPPPTG